MYTFKEVNTKTELKKLFKMRYADYSQSQLKKFIHENPKEIDIDYFDLQSKHFGIYCDGAPIGFIRVVNNKNDYFNENSFEIGQEFGFFNQKACDSSQPEFPFVSYDRVPESVTHFYENTAQHNLPIIEAGRFHITKNHRGIRIAKFAIESSIVLYLFIHNRAKFAVINCDERKAGFYRKYGFKIVNNSDRIYMLGNRIKKGCLLNLKLSPSKVPETLLPKFEEMATEYQETNQIRRSL